MGLFSRKKKETLERKLPEFPKFPELPAKPAEQEHSPIPEYQPSFQQQPAYTLPQQQKQVNEPFTLPQQDVANANPFSRGEKEVITERPRIPAFAERPPMTQEQQGFWKAPIADRAQEPMELQSRPEMQGTVEEKPVFVKLQQYREAMASIEMLKQKVKEAEYILGKLEEIRAQEQAELTNCQGNLTKIKEKLIEIDKRLFEV